MKILAIGATYIDNFGDMLFAKMIADRLKSKTEFRFNIVSDFCKEFVGNGSLSDFEKKDGDALLYFPGGYLGDRHVTNIRVTYLWYKRFFPLGLYYARHKKPIMIMAVDAGPCKYGFMRMIIRYICKHSWKIVVRNEDSKLFLESIGVSKSNIFVTSDYAQLIRYYPLPIVKQFEAWRQFQKQVILIHVNECWEAINVVIPAIKKYYMTKNGVCSFVVASDQRCSNDDKVYDIVKSFAGVNTYFYKYGDPMELCSIINGSDCVITYKLHVGIVASAFSKSVIAIPQHYKKVIKYYKQINEIDRVIPLKDVNSDNLYLKICKYEKTPVILPDSIIELAKKNNEYLNEFLTYVKKRIQNY